MKSLIHISRDAETKPALFNRKKGDLKIPGPALVELLRAVLDKGVPFRFRAKGFSMTPFIKDGDVITVFPLEGSRPRLGDIVAFTHPVTKRLCIHRMIGKKKDNFILKGDNVSGIEDIVTLNSLLGCVKLVERNEKQAFLGLGPERFLIALLVRTRILPTLLPFLWRLVRPVVKRRPS